MLADSEVVMVIRAQGNRALAVVEVIVRWEIEHLAVVMIVRATGE